MQWKCLTQGGAVAGWIVATALAFFPLDLGEESRMALTMISLSVALFCCGHVALRRHQRPVAAAYQMGYEMGRRDALRGANLATVTPLRRELERRTGA